MSSSPTSDIAIGRHGLLTEAFELLAAGLGPFVDERMSEYFEDTDGLSWQEAAANRMGRAHEHGATDPLFQLLVIRRFWGPVFSGFFREDLRQLVEHLIEARNLWAHFNLPDDSLYLERVLLSVERLTAPVAPDEASHVRRLKARLKQPDAGDNGPEPRTGVDMLELRAQLGETEGAFQQLQVDYSKVSKQLEISRKASAGKELRLHMLERELADASDETETLRLHIAAQQQTTERLHWMFTGFITVMMMLMVLLAV